ncbi:hypothetical protein CHS0354_002015 [Potamilus streckersoni]|uniref:methionine adenosyltransferase n=1 Tax=Potamilus streckersoni TaxID=2493646 RepID=A0AAE0T5N9_9BIVA|nr:hypothetical protein CHS0354_002015 [Potamilus streckersoni]
MGDAGLTGRKIIVDTYGGMGRHGGGAFSGKDPSKVDRSAAYAARYIAKNIVAAGLAKECEIQISYAIGVSRPVSVSNNTFGTETVDTAKLEKVVMELFPLSPSWIIQKLDLRRPIYRKTAAYGHFGRPLPEFTWEKTDSADELRRAFNYLLTEGKFKVINKYGLHARASTCLVNLCAEYDEEVTVILNGIEADAKSILDLLMLEAVNGTEVNIRVSGGSPESEAHIMRAIGDLFARVSPAMQTAAFRSSGLNAVYLPFHIQQITPELKTAFNLLGVKGFNVTVPHKENIIPLLDTIDEQARFLRSVNTVKIENGHWSGYSTDGNGFILSLEEAGFSVNGKSVQVLGAGGSASAVCFALLKAGAAHVKILNRTPAKAKKLAEKPAEFFPEKCSEGFYQGKYDLLVNTTSAGMTEDILPCPEDLIYNAEFIADIIYRPSRTKLLQTAEHAGIPVMNGLGCCYIRARLRLKYGQVFLLRQMICAPCC